MNRLILATVLGFTLAAAPASFAAEHKGHEAHQGHAGHEAHWAYEGENGPNNWGNLKEDFAMCKTGGSQSPIDIREAAKGTGKIAFDYKASEAAVVNNGHTIQANLAAGSSITLDGKKYSLVQFHFHAPSENTVQGKASAMELHLVHKSDDGNLAVVGVLLADGAENAELKKVWASLPLKVNEEKKVSGVNPAAFLPADRSYWAFEGSLTTPPCSEHVAWNVMKNGQTVSGAQVKAFTALVGKNARPVQPLNGRKVSLN